MTDEIRERVKDLQRCFHYFGSRPIYLKKIEYPITRDAANILAGLGEGYTFDFQHEADAISVTITRGLGTPDTER